jgi:uncharacterized Rossmann fold enzyme
MRILLDECVHARFRGAFLDHDCQTARYAGFTGLKNGALLSAAEAARFDVLVTLDQNMQYQQHLKNRQIAIIVLHVHSNKISDLLPHAPACLEILRSIRAGQLVHVGN